MAVSIVPRFNKAEVRRQLQQRVQLIEQAVLLRLQRVGETFITNARNNGNYNDITGNLRSSIGYVVLKNGQQVSSAFPGSQSQGNSQGRRIAAEAAARYGTGFVLIVVAGMNYAAAVESRGKDVITGSSLIAKEDLKTALQQISRKVG